VIASGVAAILCALISALSRGMSRNIPLLFFIIGIFLLLIGVADYMTYKLKKKEEESNQQEKF
jgi:uncharacterized membrane protein HdeD (DUF308 family)